MRQSSDGELVDTGGDANDVGKSWHAVSLPGSEQPKCRNAELRVPGTRNYVLNSWRRMTWCPRNPVSPHSSLAVAGLVFGSITVTGSFAETDSVFF
jgi:hypothetical protein